MSPNSARTCSSFIGIRGCEPALAEALQRRKRPLRHSYSMLPFNSMPAAQFLSLLSVYVYKTRDSFRETCPVSVLEALAAGLPVVAENRGGIRDIVVPGETGMLCDTLQDYHRAAESLLTDPELLRQYSRRARQWARANVSPLVYRENCERLLTQHLAERAGAAVERNSFRSQRDKGTE